MNNTVEIKGMPSRAVTFEQMGDGDVGFIIDVGGNVTDHLIGLPVKKFGKYVFCLSESRGWDWNPSYNVRLIESGEEIIIRGK